jgi:hypothetical protein
MYKRLAVNRKEDEACGLHGRRRWGDQGFLATP